MPSMGGGAADGLQQVLARLFLEAQQKQVMRNQDQQRELQSRGLDLQERNIDATEGLRRDTLAATTAERTRQNEDRDAARDLTAEARLHGRLQLMPKGAPIDNPDMLVEMGRRGLGGMMTPVPNEPRFTFSGTQAAQNAEASQSDREARVAETERHNREMEGLAGQRNQQSASPAAPALSPTAESNIINRLSKQWQASVAPVAELSRQVKLMDTGLAAARRGDMAQGAQTILVTFQKILDPPSVVRESEYARSAAGQSLVNRVKGYMEQLVVGGAGVSVQELEKFAALAKEAAATQSKGHIDAVRKRLTLTADRYNIPHELIVEDFMPSSEPAPAPAPAGATGAPNPQDLINKYRKQP